MYDVHNRNGDSGDRCGKISGIERKTSIKMITRDKVTLGLTGDNMSN